MSVGMGMRVRAAIFIFVGTDTVVREDVSQEVHPRSADSLLFRR